MLIALHACDIATDIAIAKGSVYMSKISSMKNVMYIYSDDVTS